MSNLSPERSRSPSAAVGDDFEWRQPVAGTTWTNNVAAKTRGRRAVYGSRANNRGASRYGRNRQQLPQRSMVRDEETIGRSLSGESVGGLGADDPALNFAPSTSNASLGSGGNAAGNTGSRQNSAAGLGGMLAEPDELQRVPSINSARSATSFADSSISSSGTASGSLFDQVMARSNSNRSNSTGAAANAATTNQVPPRPSATRRHSRSNSASAGLASLPGRPPVSQGFASLHQRSLSFMSPLGSGAAGINGNNVSSSLSLEGLDRENNHPNLSSLNSTPQKVFGSSFSAPNSAAPSPSALPMQSLDDEASNSNSNSNGAEGRSSRQKKKTRTDDVVPRPMSSPHGSVASSASFSSLSKLGDVAPTWVKRSLQDCISNPKGFGNGSRSANASPAMKGPPMFARTRSFSTSSSNQSASHHASLRPSSSFGGGPSSTASQPDDMDLINPSNSACLGGYPSSSSHPFNLSSPTRSIAAGSTASSRKRGVCESPTIDGDNVVYSPGGSGMLSCSSRRSRARSRIFSPDSTRKLMAKAARSMCGIVDDDFLRSVGTGPDVFGSNGLSQHSLGQHSKSSETMDDPMSSSKLDRSDQNQHRGHRKRGNIYHDDTDESDDDDHSTSSMVDASMETEGSEAARGIVMASRLNKIKNNDDDDGDYDPTARLFGATGAGDDGRNMSPPPKAFRRCRSDTFAESIFGSVDGSGSMSVSSPDGKMQSSPKQSAAPLPISPCDIGADDVALVKQNKGKGGKKTSSTSKDNLENVDDEEEDPLKGISSYEDLKFVIKTLRKWSKGKNLAAFGIAGCTIVMPTKWSSDRKAAFMKWAISDLGFGLRSGGGGVTFLQTSVNKGTSILKDLEAKLLRHKELTGHTRTGAHKTVDGAEDAPPFLIVSAPQIVANSSSAHTRDIPHSVAFPQVDKDVDVDLLDNLDSLALDESVRSRPSAVAHRAAAAAAEAMTNAKIERDQQGTPLVRTVTLEPTKHGHEEQQPEPPSSLPCFAPMSVSPKDASFEISRSRAPSFDVSRPRPPRHSDEYSDCEGSGLDIMRHMHGLSPADAGSRPPRLSFPSGRPRSIGGRDSLMPPVEEATPAPASQVKMMSLVKATPTFELIETPMPEDGPGFWGSRPIPGKDWGASEKCDACILVIMLQRHDKTFAESDYCGDSPLPMITSQTPFTQSTTKKNIAPLIPSMNPLLEERTTSNLGFDLEAETESKSPAKSPVQLLRPKSRLHLDVNDSDDGEDEDEMDGEDAFDIDNDDFAACGAMDRRQTTYEAQRSSRLSTRGVYSSRGRLSRQGSVGASALSALALNDLGPSPDKLEKRRKMSLAVRKRMSLCAAAFDVNQSRRFTSFAPTLLSPVATAAAARNKSRRQTNFVGNSFAGTATSSMVVSSDDKEENEDAADIINDADHLSDVFSYLTEEELLTAASLVQESWADAATAAHASLMLVSVGCSTSFVEGESDSEEDEDDEKDEYDEEGIEVDIDGNEIVPTCRRSNDSIAKSMERSWHFLNDRFPWATFLSEGAFKRVYRVWNSTVNAEEAVSVMDVNTIEDMGNKEIVGAELSVSVLLSSLVRRNVCPNFVVTRGVFTCPYEPASSHWGCAENKKPKGNFYDPSYMDQCEQPSTPSDEERGKFQYIRMELCRHGDIEEWLKKQSDQSIAADEARILLFQMAFALHTAADRYSMKHYDVKLLNFFLQSANDDSINEARHPYTVLRYGIGSLVFGLRMPSSRALVAKLADYGTANIRPESNGQPVTIGQFTTLENTPPDFLFSGDAAKQGYGHDAFGLGLCMLHLFTGHAPYEEILENVICPVALKRKLKNIWENRSSNGYDVIRSLILADVYEDEEEGIIEGDPDEVLYDTLYRYLVLFGIPDKKHQFKEGARVWRAITSCLVGQTSISGAPAPARRSTRRRAAAANTATSAAIAGPDTAQFEIDCSIYSLSHGNDPRIAAAREKLSMMEGGIDLLMSLVSFDPNKRAMPLDVINSTFMAPLREEPGVNSYGGNDLIRSYTAMSALRN